MRNDIMKETTNLHISVLLSSQLPANKKHFDVRDERLRV